MQCIEKFKKYTHFSCHTTVRSVGLDLQIILKSIFKKTHEDL